MIRYYGLRHFVDFPDPNDIKKTLNGDIAYIKDKDTEYEYFLVEQMNNWTRFSDLQECAKEILYAEWVMTKDDFENGWGEQNYPHCSNCNRGVYRHDAGSWCPFCGKPMKNPMR